MRKKQSLPEDEMQTVNDNKKKRSGSRKGPIIMLIVILVLIGVIVAAVAVIARKANNVLNKINYTYDPYDPFDTAPIVLDDTPAPVTPDPNATFDPDATATEDVFSDPTLGPDETYAPEEAVATAEQIIQEETKNDLLMSDDVLNVMLIGSDTRDISNYRGNSDAMMMMSLNYKSKEIWLTSFQRDTYVYVPGCGYNKLNYAYPRGGAKLLLRTIQENFNVVVPYYMIVTFDEFKQVIDAVGGVEITVTDAECKYIAGIKKGGTYNLTGAQALQYARIRRIGTDFARTQRQREIIEKVIAKTKNMNPSEIMNVVNVILPLITTNMTKAQIAGLVANVATYSKYDTHELQIPINGTWYYDIYPKVTHVVVVKSFYKNYLAIKENVYAGIFD